MFQRQTVPDRGGLPLCPRCTRLQELEQKPADLIGLFLLHPMPSPFNQMTTKHVAASGFLHRLEEAGPLIRAPVLFTGDKAGGYVDAAAGPSFPIPR